MKKLLLAAAFAGSIFSVSAQQPLSTNEGRRPARTQAPGATAVKSVRPEAMPRLLRANKPAKAAEAAGVITEAPAGEIKTYVRSGFGAYSAGFYAELGSDMGFHTEVVWCADGSVYIKNPVMFYQTDSYIKGRVEGDEIVIDLPQIVEISEEGPEDEPMTFYATKIVGVYDEEYDELSFEPVSGTSEIRYKIDGDSFGRVLDEENFTMLGIAWDDYFMDYGELSCEYKPFSDIVMDAPAGLNTERWACTYGGDGHYVNIGFKDNDIYVQGIAPSIPETWIKGTIEGGKATFNSAQYLGIDPENSHVSYFYGATMSLEEDPDWGDMVMTPHLADNLVFDYNAAEKILSSDDAALINASTTDVYYHLLLDKPMIRTAPADGQHIPCNPVILNHMPASVLGTGAVQFDLPRTSTDGDILDTEKMYYNVYYDGTLTDLVEGMTDIPWDYSDGWDFSVYGITHEAYYYDTTVKAVGIQNCYRDGSEVKKSAIVYTDGTVVEPGAGVDSALTSAEETDVTYTDLTGRTVDKSAKGLLIRTATLTDGSRTVTKVIRR